MNTDIETDLSEERKHFIAQVCASAVLNLDIIVLTDPLYILPVDGNRAADFVHETLRIKSILDQITPALNEWAALANTQTDSPPS